MLLVNPNQREGKVHRVPLAWEVQIRCNPTLANKRFRNVKGVCQHTVHMLHDSNPQVRHVACPLADALASPLQADAFALAAELTVLLPGWSFGIE